MTESISPQNSPYTQIKISCSHIVFLMKFLLFNFGTTASRSTEIDKIDKIDKIDNMTIIFIFTGILLHRKKASQVWLNLSALKCIFLDWSHVLAMAI